MFNAIKNFFRSTSDPVNVTPERSLRDEDFGMLIMSLEGAPQHVGGNFYCSNTRITSAIYLTEWNRYNQHAVELSYAIADEKSSASWPRQHKKIFHRSKSIVGYWFDENTERYGPTTLVSQFCESAVRRHQQTENQVSSPTPTTSENDETLMTITAFNAMIDSGRPFVKVQQEEPVIEEVKPIVSGGGGDFGGGGAGGSWEDPAPTLVPTPEPVRYENTMTSPSVSSSSSDSGSSSSSDSGSSSSSDSGSSSSFDF